MGGLIMTCNSPLEHFNIDVLGAHVFNLSLTSDIFFYLSCVLVFAYIWLFTIFKLDNSQTQILSVVEFSYNFILDIFKNQTSSIRIFRYFPIFYVLFWFIFFSNILSLSFYNVSITGHIMLTLVFSFSFFMGIVFIGFLNNDNTFFDLFLPKGVPNFLVPFLSVIEVLSFWIRPFSLAIRLFANMLAGHTLLNIFSSFGAFVIKNFKIFYFIPFILCFFITLLEFCVSIIQAYVFIILLVIYLSEVVIIKH